ncbi:MAG: TraR/DksA family transcriptional regulator [Oligoflexia bacterium]|nr:TraR/DksA family transcriptional regulator [Oligoflexia bacterium]
METSTIENFKNLFLEIKSNYEKRQDQLTEVFDKTNSGDEVDQTLEDRDRQLLLKLKGRERHFLKKIDVALAKINNGTFGECDECGCEIEHNRLMARPTATMCIGCKEEQESAEKHIPYQKRSHTHGKEIINDNVLPFAGNNSKKQISIISSEGLR